MRPLYVCTMVFNRHDLLRRLFESIAISTKKPDGVYVVDHAYDERKIKDVQDALYGIPLEIVTIDDPGCAVAGNWFLCNVPDDRVGCGDDVAFFPDTLELMAATEGDFIIPEVGTTSDTSLNPAACCLIRNSCVEKIGFLDEKLSPHYLYYEDTDYIRRMGLAGVPITTAKGAFCHHRDDKGDGTLAHYTAAQMDEHHARFRRATANYMKKWGGLPFKETLTTPVEL